MLLTQTDLQQELTDTFRSGESVAALVLDNVTVKCSELLLPGKRAPFCPSHRTRWQTGRRGAVRNGTERREVGLI